MTREESLVLPNDPCILKSYHIFIYLMEIVYDTEVYNI